MAIIIRKRTIQKFLYFASRKEKMARKGRLNTSVAYLHVCRPKYLVQGVQSRKWYTVFECDHRCKFML